jgi:hypothetical protein
MPVPPRTVAPPPRRSPGRYGQLRKCLTCGELHWTTEACKPVYFYQIPEWHDEGEWLSVRAVSHEEAATSACLREDWNSTEFTIVHNGGLAEIRILGPDGIVKRFKVEAEAVPTYRAKEIE